MDKAKNYLELKQYCLTHGADLFGVADISKIKNDFNLSKKVTNKFNRAISLGVRLSKAVLFDIEDHPTKLYFHHYKTVNTFLDQLAFSVARFIENANHLAVPIPASQIVDWQKQSGHLSHKKIGLLAGLGWIGRNNLLVNDKFGSQVRLATILTDMILSTDKPLKRNCGKCHLCIKFCPAGAIKEKPKDFNHLFCFDKLKDFQKQKFVEQYICGICVRACKGPKVIRRLQ